MGNAALARLVTRYDSGSGKVSEDAFAEYRAAGRSFLTRTFGSDSPYVDQFHRDVSGSYTDYMHHGQGILRAARDEIAGGWIATTRGLITAEIFADFLEMAHHLLEEHYKDAAAVIIGGTGNATHRDPRRFLP